MTEVERQADLELLGAGRSGQVFLLDAPDGAVARKIFLGDTAANLVHYVFSGAPNAYIWNKDAVACAFYRRKILKALTFAWFGPRLVVSDALAYDWNEDHLAFQLDTEFIRGRPVALRHPLARDRGDEALTLIDEIMKPFQACLIEAGFDGMVWQAGKGNPVALNNFLLVDADDDPATFSCIDLESGVPALFPFNPIAFFSFYVPRSFKHGRAMFDDVDVDKLRRYVSSNQEMLETKLGARRLQRMQEEIDELARHQHAWRSMRRVERSITYRLLKGNITPEQAEWYAHHPIRWYSHELDRVSRKALHKLLIDLPIRLYRRIRTFDLLRWLHNFWRFMTSHDYRQHIARTYVDGSIKEWQDRDQLDSDEAEELSRELHSNHSSGYLTDFGVHLGIKLLVQAIEYTLLPVLFALGLISPSAIAVFILADGPIFRTVYTLYRMFQEAAAGRKLPWIALWFGLIPILGSLAYPVQVIYAASTRHDTVARFVVYHFFTKIGARIPIIGGEDTQTEHAFNRAADRLLR